MERPIRVIDGGGNGFRRADIYGKEVKNLAATKRGEIDTPQKLVGFSCADLPSRLAGVSYAMAGDIDAGVVITSAQIPWLNGCHLGRCTSDALRKKRMSGQVLVCNDMDGAVMGMAQLLPNQPYFMGMTWSSGIGNRIFRKGEILASGEGGHAPLDPSPFASFCGCGNRGCVESICGGESVKRRVLAETEILGVTIPKGMHPCCFLDRCYKKGKRTNQWAFDLYMIIARGMGTYLAFLQSHLRLPLVVWKGTFASHALPLVDEMIRRFMREKLINPSWEDEMRFTFSPEPEKDSLIGAAAFFRQTFE